MASSRFTFSMSSPKAPNVKYFSICSKCQEEHAASTKGDQKRNTLFELSSNPADVKYDIISDRCCQMDWYQAYTRTHRSHLASEGGE